MALPLQVDDLPHRLNDDSENAIIEQWIQAATDLFTNSTGYSPMDTTFIQKLECWPYNRTIYLTKRPVTAITSITYFGTDNAWHTVASNNYIYDFDASPAKIYLLPSYSLPALNQYLPQVKVTFKAGHVDADDVPAGIKTGLAALVLYWYAIREAYTDATLSPSPAYWKAFCDMYDNGIIEVIQ